MSTNTIVLVHGLSVSKHSWKGWADRFESRGYKVVTPAYHPDLDKSVEALQRNPKDPTLRTITLPQVIANHEKVIQALEEKPIIIGHSFGGLITQLLLQRGHGIAGVAIDGVPPSNIMPMQLSLFRSVLPALNPLDSAGKPWHMTFKQFQYSWVHTLPLSEQRKAYEAFIVPESRRLYRSGLTSDARVDFKKTRPPLLIIGGEKDHIMPAPLNRTNFKAYAKSPSITEYKEFPGETHYTIVAGKGWEKVADFALDWAIQIQARTVNSTSSNVGRQVLKPA